MGRIIDTPHAVFVFCPTPTCDGYLGSEVQGVQREAERTALDEGAKDPPFPNAVMTSSMRYFVPSGETDEHGYQTAKEMHCEHCDRELQVSPEPRPEYANISGQDPMTLIMRRKDAEKSRTRDDEVAALNARVELLTTLLAGQQAEKPARGRKPAPVESEAA